MDVLAKTPDRRGHALPGVSEDARARVADLTFWGAGWRLIDVLTTVAGEVAAFSFVAAPDAGGCHLIDGAAPEIHRLNGVAGLKIDAPDLAALYARFFCGVVWGAEGPFAIVEDAREIALRLDGADDLTGRPLQMFGGADAIDATIVYGEGLYACRLRIAPDGMVSMEDEELLSNGEPALRYQPPYRRLA